MESACSTCYQTYRSETAHFCENQQHEVDEIRNGLFNTSEQINEFINFFADNISNVVLRMEMHHQSGYFEQNMLKAQLDDQSGYLAHVEDPQSFQDSILQTAHSLINLLTVSRSEDSLPQDVFQNIDPPILNVDNETTASLSIRENKPQETHTSNEIETTDEINILELHIEVSRPEYSLHQDLFRNEDPPILIVDNEAPASLNFRENIPQEPSNGIEAADEINVTQTHMVPIDFAVANSSKDQDCGIGEEHMEIFDNHQREMNQQFEILEQTLLTVQMDSRPIHAGNFEEIDKNKNMHLLRCNPTTHTVSSSLPNEDRSGCNTSENSVADFTMATSKQSSELDDGSSMRYEEVSVEKQIPTLETSKKIGKTSIDYTNKVSGSVKFEKDRFICHVCGKQFRYKYELTYHSLHHSNVKPFTCEVCEGKFKTKSGLRNHMYIHFKRHRCSFCQKLFAQKYLLKEHTLQHTGEKPFQCNICGKSFRAKRHLSVHMYTHSEL